LADVIYENDSRCGWRGAVGYGQRLLVETATFRYKTLIGPTLRARKFAAQQVEPGLLVA
jgi:hypothetical protein